VGNYRPVARDALQHILKFRMNNAIDAHLEQKRAQGFPDRRNGSYPRHLLTELEDLGLGIPRTRTFSARILFKRFARRAFSIERLVLLSFLFGLSTRKVVQALPPILGERVSHATVSQIGKQFDQAVQSYHQRPLLDAYEVLLLDGIVMKRRTGVFPP
jgi:putative transposase